MDVEELARCQWGAASNSTLTWERVIGWPPTQGKDGEDVTPQEMLDKLDRWIRWYCPGVLEVAEKPSLSGLQEIRDYIASTLEPWTTEPPTEPGWYWWRDPVLEKGPRVMLADDYGDVLRVNGMKPTTINGEWQRCRPPND